MSIIGTTTIFARLRRETFLALWSTCEYDKYYNIDFTETGCDYVDYE